MRGNKIINISKIIFAVLLLGVSIAIMGRLVFGEGGPLDVNNHNEATSHYENIASDTSVPDSSVPESSTPESLTSNNSLTNSLLQFGFAILCFFGACTLFIFARTGLHNG